jgi:hypothetical protein
MRSPRFSPRPQTTSSLACIAGLTALLHALAPSPGRACGYHDDVSIARGALNWTYPDALHVIGAISAAVMEKRLQLRDAEPVAPGLFGTQYHATAKLLERLAASLRAAADAPALSFSLVLLEPMLWTRFEATPGEINMQIHVANPQPGDLILISGQDVIRAVAEDELAIGEAHRRGLIRLYGNETQVAAFLGAFRDVGRERPGVHNQTRSAPAGSHSAVMQ